jgi:hypothetical protein
MSPVSCLCLLTSHLHQVPLYVKREGTPIELTYTAPTVNHLEQKAFLHLSPTQAAITVPNAWSKFINPDVAGKETLTANSDKTEWWLLWNAVCLGAELHRIMHFYSQYGVTLVNSKDRFVHLCCFKSSHLRTAPVHTENLKKPAAKYITRFTYFQVIKIIYLHYGRKAQNCMERTQRSLIISLSKGNCCFHFIMFHLNLFWLCMCVHTHPVLHLYIYIICKIESVCSLYTAWDHKIEGLHLFN